MKSRNDDACLRFTDQRKSRMRRLNDNLRKGRGKGELLVTPGVIDLANGALPDIFALLRAYDAFSTDNDSYSEHDFGAFSYRGAKLFWKIDYYDRSLRYGSDDPANGAITTRVLTLMLVSEY